MALRITCLLATCLLTRLILSIIRTLLAAQCHLTDTKFGQFDNFPRLKSGESLFWWWISTRNTTLVFRAALVPLKGGGKHAMKHHGASGKCQIHVTRLDWKQR